MNHSMEMVLVMFEKIVVAIDGSEASAHALNTACDLAGKYNSEVYLVHSPQVETTGIAVGSGAVEIAPTSEEIAKAGKKVIDQALTQTGELGCTPANCIVANGDPAREILKAVDAVDADLVVMGRRGLGRVKSLLMGSVSQEVSHNAQCTCMTVS